jgi:hypothetical protein
MKLNINSVDLGRPMLNALKRAELLSNDTKFLAAVDYAAGNEQARNEAINDSSQYLKNQGVVVPKNLLVTFINKPSKPLPPPDQPLFLIRLFNCKSFWLPKKNQPGHEQVEICFGYEIRPSIVVGGPIT